MSVDSVDGLRVGYSLERNAYAFPMRTHSGVGTIQYPVGTKMGTIGAYQDTSKKLQDCPDAQQKDGDLKISEGVGWAYEAVKKWTILDSNQRPPRCQRGALTN